MCIIWDKKSKGGIDVNSGNDIFCIDEDKLKNFIKNEAGNMKVKFYNSYQQFVEHNSEGGIFDLSKYETNIDERIQNENYQEQSYKKKTNDMSLSSQPHTKKKARQYEKRANIVKTFIRDKRDKSQREHIFRTFMRVHRSIPDELRTIKPHRLSPTLFLDVPYRSISKRNIPDSHAVGQM
jgi:hypothetical protein